MLLKKPLLSVGMCSWREKQLRPLGERVLATFWEERGLGFSPGLLLSGRRPWSDQCLEYVSGGAEARPGQGTGLWHLIGRHCEASNDARLPLPTGKSMVSEPEDEIQKAEARGRRLRFSTEEKRDTPH